jgi:hypothetical protein
MPLRLAPLLLVCACASTATSVDTFADPADATEGVVAALRSGDPAEANRIFGLYARASVLRDSVFYAVIEAASADYIAGQDESGRRLVEFAQANYPQAGYASADELEAELRAGLAEGAAVIETAYANAAGALAALSAVQEAIDNEEFPLAVERFDAFLQSWNGEPAELQAEVDRIKLLLPEG